MSKKLKSFRNVDVHFVWEDLENEDGEKLDEHICELLIKRKDKTIKIVRPLLYHEQYVRGEREPISLEDRDFLTLGVINKKDDYVMDLEGESPQK